MGSEATMSSAEVVEKLVEMGFKKSDADEAVEAVGLSVGDAVNYIVSGCCRGVSNCSTKNQKRVCKAISSSSSGLHVRQSSILDHYRPNGRHNQCKDEPSISGLNKFASPVQEDDCGASSVNDKPEVHAMQCSEEPDVLSDWEQRANILLRKHFGYKSLKNFQKEALSAWVAHMDCLVLAATGSGKSLCFQLPALLTGKVVIVISPLISLMHDQCLKLSKHGVSACFLGSGQPDNSVEKKAMEGMYSVVYVCPETLIRLITPFQRLAESRGIALFAVDEVHCVSKWGHDFRPDYRRLSVLRENFSSRNLECLSFDVPIMALTATATVRVREDILNSLYMSNETKIVLTSFFRQNLKFSVKHSKTTSPSSYEKDFCNLIDVYVRKRNHCQKKQIGVSGELDNESDSDLSSHSDSDDVEGGETDEDNAELYSRKGSSSTGSREKRMSVEYLENDVDIFRSVDDWDVACEEFHGQTVDKNWNVDDLTNMVDSPCKQNEVERLMQEPLEPGPTIIYVPTRKETLSIAKYLCSFGVKAAAYNASLPKSHLRKVHKEFQENSLEVVVATIAFGMGIDKLNVRRIIHYGWPQSLEAYYQEAGRAGRDGKLAECVLYANLSHIPTLLPSRRSEDQTKQAYKMLSDCFRYGMNTSCCRAKMLVEYFGEDLSQEKCFLCDVCVNGPPEMKDCREEARILLEITAACSEQSMIGSSYDDALYGNLGQRPMKKPNLRNLVCKIREQSQRFLASDLIWWRGLARIMEDKRYIRETDGKVHVQIKFPEITRRGLEFIESETEEEFRVYPEADMLLSMRKCGAYSSFSEWGKGWADPEIRRQRLEKFHRSNRMPKKRKFGKFKPDSRTARGRIAAKIFKKR